MWYQKFILSPGIAGGEFRVLHKASEKFEESVAKGDEEINEYKAGAWLFLYCSGP